MKDLNRFAYDPQETSGYHGNLKFHKEPVYKNREEAEKAIEKIKSEGIEKTHIFCYQDNETGQKFWRDFGFVKRDDIFDFSYQ